MSLTYCPTCKAALKKLTDTEYLCDNGHPYYNNPRAAAAVLIIKDKQVLLARRGREPHKGMFDLPGGFVELRESPEQAAKREILEETGLSIDNLELLSASSHVYQAETFSCDLVFWAHQWQGTIQAQDDVAELVWQPYTELDGDKVVWHYPGLVDTLSKRL